QKVERNYWGFLSLIKDKRKENKRYQMGSILTIKNRWGRSHPRDYLATKNKACYLSKASIASDRSNS
ncbi:MAG: hypothetical protein AAFN00_18910, partial [Cyanobacteria bacterium J06558_2]